MSAIPKEAREILADGDFCYLAAPAPGGPHLTPLVFAFDGGRLWVTTSRSSVKAKIWRGDPTVAGLVRLGDRAVTFRGAVRTYDALDPFTWPLAVIGSGRLLRAATRFTVKNARFFFGYAVDATGVPMAWAPPGRIFNGIQLRAGRVLDLAKGRAIDAWGEWSRGDEDSRKPANGGSAGRRPASSASLARALDRDVPASVLGAVGRSGDGVVAVRGGGAGGDPTLTVLPATWRRTNGSFDVTLPTSLLTLAAPGPASVVALTMDQSSTWRARHMRGMLLRGPAGVARGRGSRSKAVITLRPRSVVWWEGWTSGTVRLAPDTTTRVGA